MGVAKTKTYVLFIQIYAKMSHENKLKAALVNIFISIMGQITVCNVKVVAHSGEPTVPLSAMEHFSITQLIDLILQPKS